MNRKPIDRMGSPTTVVLYRTEDRWRYALYADGGVMDGYLPGLDPSATDTIAKLRMKERITESFHPVEIAWQDEKPDWWRGEISLPPPS